MNACGALDPLPPRFVDTVRRWARGEATFVDVLIWRGEGSEHALVQRVQRILLECVPAEGEA